MYKTVREVTEDAERLNMTIGAFNMHNLEMLPDMIRAAKEMGSPIIIQTSIDTAKYIGYNVIVAVVKELANSMLVDVALHLDHAKDFDAIKDAIDAGYSSVMFDGSSLPFKENIEKTRLVVEFAHARGVSVEGELGTVGGKEDTHEVKDSEKSYTDPEEAKEFAEQTGVDFLAVGIGNAHGFYKGVPKLRFDILEKTKSLVSIPIVLHGASGIPDEDVKKSTGLGICKVNFATELRDAFTKGVKEYLEKNPEVFDPKKYNGAGREKVKELIKHKMHVLNSVHKA